MENAAGKFPQEFGGFIVASRFFKDPSPFATTASPATTTAPCKALATFRAFASASFLVSAAGAGSLIAFSSIALGCTS